jgi:hypothetical protein
LDDDLYKRMLLEYLRDVFPLKKIRAGKRFRHLFTIPYDVSGNPPKYYSPNQELQKEIVITEINKIMISVFGYKQHIIKEVVKLYIEKKNIFV